MARVRLIIPYISQLVPKTETDYAQGDCGPSCLAALVRAKSAQHIAVDTISRAIRPGGGFVATSVSELANYAPKQGITLKVVSRVSKAQLEQQITNRHTVILLVYYPALPRSLQYDPNYSFNHYITVHGMDGNLFFYDDPYWPDNRGENKAIDKDALVKAAWRVVQATPGLALFCSNVSLPIATNQPKDGGTVPVPAGFTLEGTIRDAASRPLPNAGVRLQAKRDLLGHIPGVDIAPPHGAVVWSKIRNNLKGGRWDFWDQNVKTALGLEWKEFNNELLRLNPPLQQTQAFVEGVEYKLPELAHTISWTRPVRGVAGTRDEAYVAFVAPTVVGQPRVPFYDEVVAHNPALKANPVLSANTVYRFPENAWGIEVQWTRTVSGLPRNNRSGLFESEIRGKVLGLTHNQFIEEFTQHNPVVNSDQGIILPEREYTLPTNVPAEMYYLTAWTGADGKYRFTGLKEGRYVLIVNGVDHQAYSDTVFVGENKTFDVKLALAPTDGRDVEDDSVTPTQTVQLPPYIYGEAGHLYRDGQPFRFIGATIPGLLHYGTGRDKVLRKTTNDTRLRQMSTARELGISVVRVMVGYRYATVTDIEAQLLDLLEAAAHLDLYVIATLTDRHDARNFYVKGDATFYRTPTKSHGHALTTLFFEKGYKRHYLPLAQTLARRFRDNERLLAWELGNGFSADNPDTFISFAHSVAAAIQDVDPFHMILPGIAGSFEAGLSLEQAFRLYNHTAIHAVTTSSPEGGVSKQDLEVAKLVKRPLFVINGGIYSDNRADAAQNMLSMWFADLDAAGVVLPGFAATDASLADASDPNGYSFRDTDHADVAEALEMWSDRERQ